MKVALEHQRLRQKSHMTTYVITQLFCGEFKRIKLKVVYFDIDGDKKNGQVISVHNLMMLPHIIF
jgi:hypothetical protein